MEGQVNRVSCGHNNDQVQVCFPHIWQPSSLSTMFLSFTIRIVNKKKTCEHLLLLFFSLNYHILIPLYMNTIYRTTHPNVSMYVCFISSRHDQTKATLEYIWWVYIDLIDTCLLDTLPIHCLLFVKNNVPGRHMENIMLPLTFQRIFHDEFLCSQVMLNHIPTTLLVHHSLLFVGVPLFLPLVLKIGKWELHVRPLSFEVFYNEHMLGSWWMYT